MKKLIEIKRRGSDESGFTLLEYCAGAAVIIGVVWVALDTMGGNLGDFLKAVGDWADKRTEQINGAETSVSGGGSTEGGSTEG